MSPTTEPRATLHAIWQTRPGRRQGDRKIAGVAAAIARRYDIDPVLVRIAFVVAAFYGVGILLYLLAWVALPPDPGDPPRGPFVRRGGAVHPLVLIAAIVAALAGAGSLLSGDPGVLVGLAVLGGLLYVLHQSRSERGLTAGATTSGQVGEAAVAADPAGLVPGAGGGGRPARWGRPQRRCTRRRWRRAGPGPTCHPVLSNRNHPPGIRSAPPRSPGTCPSPARPPHRSRTAGARC